MQGIIFYILAGLTVISTVAMITRGRPVVSAFWLLVFVLSLAGLFAALSAPFVSAMYAIVSLAAAVTLYTFVIVLVGGGGPRTWKRTIVFGRALGIAAAVYLAMVLSVAILRPPFFEQPMTGESFGSISSLGRVLFSSYMLPFEFMGVLFLVIAMCVASAVARNSKMDCGFKSRHPERSEGSPIISRDRSLHSG